MQKFKPMPTRDETSEFQLASDLISDMEAQAMAQDSAPFAPIEIKHGKIYFSKVREKPRLILEWPDGHQQFVASLKGPTRVEVVNALKELI